MKLCTSKFKKKTSIHPHFHIHECLVLLLLAAQLHADRRQIGENMNIITVGCCALTRNFYLPTRFFVSFRHNTGLHIDAGSHFICSHPHQRYTTNNYFLPDVLCIYMTRIYVTSIPAMLYISLILLSFVYRSAAG